MGKSKKIRNWKARQVVEGVIEEKETKAVAACVVIDNEEVKSFLNVMPTSKF